MARSTLDLASIDPGALAAELPEAEGAAFVHLDLYPGNVLTDGSSITAVLDFGATCVVGDRRLDPLSAVVYLEAPEISPSVRAEDIEVARRWLQSRGLQRWLEPARRWLAAYWSFAVDDPKVLSWSARILAASR
jgi:aminoglycoside phosphotransferase (APT) family kinase protein